MEQTVFNKHSAEADLANARINLQEASQAVEDIEKEIGSYPEDRTLAQRLDALKVEEKIFSEQVEATIAKDFERYAELEHQLNLWRMASITDQDSEEYKTLDAYTRYYQAVQAVGGTHSVAFNDSSEAAFFTGRSMTAWLSSIVLFILIAVLISDSVSSEIESSQIRLHHLLGGRKLKHLLIKLGVPILVTFVATLLTFSIIYVVKGLRDGFGTWHYPYLLEDRSIQPIWKITLATVFLYLITLIFIGSMGQLLSLLFKKSLVVFGLIAVFLTGFMTLSMEEWFQPFKMFFPFEYMGYGQIINDIHILPPNAFVLGSLYLLGLSLVFMMISGYLYKHYYFRKDEKL